MLAKVLDALRSIPAKLGRVETRAYIPELDGLRCLAIMFVLVWHASLRAARYIDHVNADGGHVANYYKYVPHGEIGVILFFFISGFVVSQPFVAKPRSQWRIGDFYKRRFLRIYPPYLIAITLCFFALAIIGHKPVDAYAFRDATVSLNRSFLASLVYLHGIVFNAPSPLNPPMWSLEIEVLFYAVLPPLMLVYCLRPERHLRIGVLCALIVAAVFVSSLSTGWVQTDVRLRWGLFYHAYLFLIGVVVADVVGDAARREREKRVAFDGLFAGGVLILLAIGWMMTGNDARLPNSAYAVAIQALTIVALLLIFTGAFHGRATSALLSLGWVRFIGTMCYSIYLTHIIVMTALGEVLGRALRSHDTNLIYIVYLSVLITASLVVGCLFYVCVERPFARRLAKLKVPRADGQIPTAVGAGSAR